MKEIINLLDINDLNWSLGSADSSWNLTSSNSRIRKDKRVPVKPNTQYTLKCAPGYQIYLRQFSSESTNELNPMNQTWRDNNFTFRTESNANFLGVILRRSSDANISLSELPVINPVIFEGALNSYPLNQVYNYPAVLSQKNLLIIEPRMWPQGVRQQNQSIQIGNYRITYGGTFPKVEENKTYRLEMNTSYKAGVFVFDKNNVCLLDTGWKYGPFDFVIPPSGTKISVNFAMSNDGAIDPNRIIQSGLTIFKKNPDSNKPAKMYRGKNFLTFPDGEWTRRPGTLNTTFTENRLEWDNFQDYAGVQILLEDALLQGKTVTFGGKRHVNATIILYYRKADGSNAYIGLGSNEVERTLTIPYGASECRFYVQNANGVRGILWAEDLYLNLDSDKMYTPSKKQNKQADLSPKKNLLKDVQVLDSSNVWLKENGVESCVRTGEKFKGADVYRITFLPDKNGRVYQLFEDKGIVSASIWIKYIQYDTTLLLTLREQNFGTSAGLVSINTDSPDWQYIKLENSNVQTSKPYMFALYKSGMTQTRKVIVDIAMPQLEKGPVATSFELYKLSNKKDIKTVANLIDKNSLTPNMYVRDSDGVVTASGAGMSALDFVSIEEGKSYVFENAPYSFTLQQRYAFYDKNKVFISGTSHYSSVSANNPKTFVAPKGAAYVRTALLPSELSTARFYCVEDNTKSNNLGLDRAPIQDLPIVTSRNLEVAKGGKLYGSNQTVVVNGGIQVSETLKEMHKTKQVGIIDNMAGSLEFTYIPAEDQATLKNTTVNRTYFSTGGGQQFRVWCWGGGSTHIINFDMTASTGNRTFFDFGTTLTTLQKGVPITFRIEWSITEFKLFVNGENRLTKTINAGGSFNTQPLTNPLYIGWNTTEYTPMPGVMKDITVKDRNGNVTLKL
ncbi:hypothetical protein Slash_44 [Bacillus phage Slash]|uniref:Uncharacterized protein n=1 Tax=Bacillus phage Slash TaxID=1406790 RepID=U5Q0C9_9CAUD|nr:hypothetical protein Slash_44 [Bacillus phage Slash]AGY48333.1 hypothetical protein Slash_44 [Bacillus phage Slash]